MPTTLEHERRVDEAEVGWIVSKRAAAMRARDADWLAARYLPGAPVVGPTPPLTRIADPGGDVPRLWEWFRLLQGRIGWSVRIQQVRVDGDRATCHCVEHVSVRGWMQRRARLTLVTTIGLRRVHQVWRIEWEHAVAE